MVAPDNGSTRTGLLPPPGRVHSLLPPRRPLAGFADRDGVAIADDWQGMLPETPQGFFKNSISIACCPILRSSWAIRSASSFDGGRLALPGNASSPFARHSPFQVSSRLGLT